MKVYAGFLISIMLAIAKVCHIKEVTIVVGFHSKFILERNNQTIRSQKLVNL